MAFDDLMKELRRIESDVAASPIKKRSLVGRAEYKPSGWEIAGDVSQAFFNSLPAIKRERTVNLKDQAKSIFEMAKSVNSPEMLVNYTTLTNNYFWSWNRGQILKDSGPWIR